MPDPNTIEIDEIVEYVCSTYAGVVDDENWGERALFYNPREALPKGTYILSFKERNGDNDSVSKFDRAGIYRLNLGVLRRTFVEMFGRIPARPPAGKTIAGPWDFSAIDEIIPHPVYAWMAWVEVQSPREPTFEILKPLIDEGYRLAVGRFNKRTNIAGERVTAIGCGFNRSLGRLMQ